MNFNFLDHILIHASSHGRHSNVSDEKVQQSIEKTIEESV